MKRRLLKQNIGKLYLYWFFHALIFAYVIERLYWEQRGITVVQVVILEIFYTVIVSLLEVPTGYLADRWSSKWLMVLGAFFTCLEFGTLIWATTFAQFALAIFWAAIRDFLPPPTLSLRGGGFVIHLHS